MNIKRALIPSVIIFLFSTIVFAYTYTSPNYSLGYPKIVISGGKANSSSYSLNGVEIGNPSAGKGKSANYSLEASPIGKSIIPNPPTLDPVTSPTNNPTQTLSGTKDKATSIYINDYEAVPLDSEITWIYDATLTEGNNIFIITSKNIFGQESTSVAGTIILDTIPPSIVIDSPLDSTVVTADRITVEGTVDGAPLSEEKDLEFGLNLVTIERSDEAGNTSSESIELYRAREPIAPPQS